MTRFHPPHAARVLVDVLAEGRAVLEEAGVDEATYRDWRRRLINGDTPKDEQLRKHFARCLAERGEQWPDHLGAAIGRLITELLGWGLRAARAEDDYRFLLTSIERLAELHASYQLEMGDEYQETPGATPSPERAHLHAVK